MLFQKAAPNNPALQPTPSKTAARLSLIRSADNA